jgi:hypothetical protein
MSKHDLPHLIRDVAEARARYIAVVVGLSSVQADFKPSPEVWSATQNTEHLVRAEDGGVNGMWRALEGVRAQAPVWSGEHIHRGLSIEAVVAKTWQPKETVPEVAAPVWGGSLKYWVAALETRQQVLEAFARELSGVDLESIIYPHPISGPLDIRQRLAFLRFHLDRHRQQVERLKQHPGF